MSTHSSSHGVGQNRFYVGPSYKGRMKLCAKNHVHSAMMIAKKYSLFKPRNIFFRRIDEMNHLYVCKHTRLPTRASEKCKNWFKV